MGEVSICGMSADIQVAHMGLHFGEEPPISGTKGSGTIFLEGCNLRCVFCQNFQISQEFKPGQGHVFPPEDLATEMLSLQKMGAHNINFVSPSHMIFQIADAIVLAKQKGLHIPVVYNSNGYDSPEALKKIRGLVDIYMPDVKYMDDATGWRFSKVREYAKVVPGVLKEMFDQVGELEMDWDGIALKGLLVRHLVLPGFLDNSKKCMDLVADISPDIFVSLLSQYSPQYKACNYPEINRTLTKREYDRIQDYVISLGMENVFVQELQSRNQFLPDFNLHNPFDTQK